MQKASIHIATVIAAGQCYNDINGVTYQHLLAVGGLPDERLITIPIKYLKLAPGTKGRLVFIPENARPESQI